MEQKQYLANTATQHNERAAITAAHMMTGIDNTGSTTMDSLISINQAAGPLGALIEWLCVVVESLAVDGGWWGTDNGLQRITRDEPLLRDGREEEEGGECSRAK